VGTAESPRWRTSGAAAGILFVVLLVVSIVTNGGAPMPDKSAAEIVKWYSAHRSPIYVSALTGTLASIAFFWFLAYVRQVLAGRSAVFDMLRDGLVISGLATAIVGGINALPQVALAITANRPDLPPNDSVVRMLADFNQLFFAPLGIFLSLTVAILAAICLMGGLAPRWAGWIAALSAVASLIGSCANFFPDIHGKPNPLGLLGLIAFLLFLVTVLITSITLLRGAPRIEVAAA